jgi:arylsulfatase A-like enzyme
MDFEFCRTLGELESRLQSGDRTSAVFAYSLSQDIHMSRLPRTAEGGDEFRQFYAPYAVKVHALDACFGRFIDELKRLRMYEQSLIVLTSDHGEMLGEDGYFGHSYHLFPQIVRVPLIVHLPASVSRASLDPAAVSRTIDIAPTLHAALGYKTVRTSELMGRALVGEDSQSFERRRATYVVAASYGAVYATLRHNGRRLYIANGIRGGDQAFERGSNGAWAPAEVSEGLRAVNQYEIRRHVNEIARLYGIGNR